MNVFGTNRIGEPLSSNTYICLIVAAVAVGIIYFLYVCIPTFSGRSPRRSTVLLMGLPNSGKTALFARLTQDVPRPHTCMSMGVNEGYLRKSLLTHGASAEGTSGILVVDHAGHRRLFPSLRQELRRAAKVILVVDTVSIHDDRHDGALAVADFLLRVVQTPEFYGVKEVLVACTKRDDVASYSSKAVRKLLEAAMTGCISSRKGQLSQVEQVMDSKGMVIKKSGKLRENDNGRSFYMDLEDNETFSFETSIPIPVRFADVSAFSAESEGATDSSNLDAVVAFACE